MSEKRSAAAVPRISCHAALDKATCAPFRKEKVYEIRQRHQVRQEIRGTHPMRSSMPFSLVPAGRAHQRENGLERSNF
jgi:hypothetical protein